MPPYKRVVVKLGTSVLTGGGEQLDEAHVCHLMDQVADLCRRELQVVVVTSAAVAAGRRRLGPLADHANIPLKQVYAAVGQWQLMGMYDRTLGNHGLVVAQALLTRADCSHRQGYLNARNTLLALLAHGVVPVVNENDVVATDEFRIGDNDHLSAMVANLIDADLLVLLSDVDGLYDSDPRCNASAQRISLVKQVDRAILSTASSTWGAQGTGGMHTKLLAARLACSGGTEVVIANGRQRDVLSRLLDGEPLGTRFEAATSPVESRRRWILSARVESHVIEVDTGAVRAVTELGRSLLPSGVVAVRGRFSRGAPVSIQGPEGQVIACAVANYDSAEIERIRGRHSDEIAEILGYTYGSEIAHRNNLVLC